MNLIFNLIIVGCVLLFDAIVFIVTFTLKIELPLGVLELC